MKGIRIRLEKEGLRTSLFDLEAEIMELGWDRDWDEFTVAMVHEAIEGKRKVAYTTIMTTVSRLFDKELLSRHKDGRRYIYRSKMSRDEFIEAMTREVLDSLPPVGHETAVAMLVEQVATADQNELDRLEELIKKRREQDE